MTDYAERASSSTARSRMVIESATYSTGWLRNRFNLVLLIVPNTASSFVLYDIIEIPCFSVSSAIISVATLNLLQGALTSWTQSSYTSIRSTSLGLLGGLYAANMLLVWVHVVLANCLRLDWSASSDCTEILNLEFLQWISQSLILLT